MIRESRQEKKIKAALRAQFALTQRLARIDWEVDVLLPKINEFLDKATLPEPPTDLGIEVEFTDTTGKRARKNRKSS